MKIRFLPGAVIAVLLAIIPARAGDDVSLARMIMCKDSWLDWNKNAPAQLKQFGDHFRSEFSHNGNDAFSTPVKPMTVAGLRVMQAYPESVGMGVGFSVIVEAPFDKTRRVMEREFGKPLQKCDAGDGMHMCELDIAEQRTFTVMAEDDEKNRTLVGCYYLYEK